VMSDWVGAGDLVGLSQPLAAQAATCLFAPQGCVTGSTSGDAAVITGTRRTRATKASPGSTSGSSASFIPPTPLLDANGLDVLCALLRVKPRYCPAPLSTPGPAVPGHPAMTLRDLAAFVPANPLISAEPNGWGLSGLPVNFVGGSTVHTRDGKLFGAPAQVRFLPRTFRWSYGDGAVNSTVRPGFSWRVLGLPDFSPTATSHTFARSGRYVVGVRVSFAVEYRVGQAAWRSVAGSLVRSAQISVLVTNAGTPLLVSGACVAARLSPGC